MREIEGIISEWEGVTNNKLTAEDRALLIDFIESGCRTLCEKVV